MSSSHAQGGHPVSPCQGWTRAACWTASTAAQRSVFEPALGERAGARALARLLELGGKARVAEQPARRPEADDVADLAGERQPANRRLYRAFLLKEELRVLYHLEDPSLAPDHLKAWLAWASRSKLKPFVKLARTIRRYRDGILAAIGLGLSNARLEGLNSKVRLISHRSFGFHSHDPLIALISPCAGGIVIDPPFTTNS